MKSAGLIAFITIWSKIAGFLTNVLKARAFGTTYMTDAYSVSLTIPNIVFGLIGVAITTAFIPLLNEVYSKKGKEDMFEFANTIINILLIFSIILYIIGWFAVPLIVKLIAPDFNGEKYSLTVYLTKLSIVNILFMSMNSGFAAILQTMNDFTAPTLTGIIIDIPIIIYTIFLTKYGIIGLTIATTVGFSFQVLTQIPWLIKNKYRYSLKVNFRDPRIIKMLTLIAPVLIGLTVNQINTIVDRTMASGLPDGSITALDYANLLNGAVYSIFASSVVTVLYPTLSKAGSQKAYADFKNYIVKAINNINMIIIPSAIGIMILRVHIIDVLFKHGQFNSYGVQMTATALLFLAIGMIFYGIRDIFNIAFYSLNDTKKPMMNGVLGVSANIAINLVLVRYIGLAGLAIGTTTSAIICSMLLIKDFRKKMGQIGGRDMIMTGFKILLSCFVMSAVILVLNKYLSVYMYNFKSELLGLVIIIFAGAISYVSMLYVLKVKEFKYVTGIVIRKIQAIF